MGQCMESMGAAQAAAYTIYEIIDRVPIIDSESNSGNSFENGDIKFSWVDFTFPAREEQQVLKGVSFEVGQGQTVALCGQSGCGKSTCIKLLQRFYDVCSGSITIAGSNIKVSAEEWQYGTYPEIAQKVIEGAKVTCRNMHVILRWLKIRTV